MVRREVKGNGMGGLEDAEPAHNIFEMRGLFVLVLDSSGCPKGSEEGILVDGVSPVCHKGQPAEHNGLAAVLGVLRDVLVEGERVGLSRAQWGEYPAGVAEDVAKGEVLADVEEEKVCGQGVDIAKRRTANEAAWIGGVGQAVGSPEGVSG